MEAQCEHRLCEVRLPLAYEVATWEIVTAVGLRYDVLTDDAAAMMIELHAVVRLSAVKKVVWAAGGGRAPVVVAAASVEWVSVLVLR